MTGIPMVTLLLILIAIAFISCIIACIYEKPVSPEKDSIAPNDTLLPTDDCPTPSKECLITMMPIPALFLSNVTWPKPALGRLACIKSFVRAVSDAAYGNPDINRKVWNCNYSNIPGSPFEVVCLIEDFNTRITKEKAKQDIINRVPRIGHPVIPSHRRTESSTGLSRTTIVSLVASCIDSMVSTRLCALAPYLVDVYLIKQDRINIKGYIDELRVTCDADLCFGRYVRLADPTIRDLLTSMWQQLVVCDEEFTVDDATSIIQDITSIFDVEPEQVPVLFPTETMRRGDE